MSLRIEWIGEPEGFARLAADWDRMLPGDARPFDSHHWYTAWYRAFGEHTAMRVCLAWEGDRIEAAFPLVERRRQLLAGMANVHSPVFRPIGRSPQAIRAVVEAALGKPPGNVQLPALPAGDPAVSSLSEAAAAAGSRHVLTAEHVSPIVGTAGTYEDWRASSKPRWGAPLERFRRKMARDHEAELWIAQPPADLDAELASGFAVEASGWKGQSGTAIASDERTLTFYSEIARSFAERDQLRLSRIVLDGQWAAFDLCLLYGDRLYLLKTGYDERFRRLAPGLVMRLSTVERCFELGLRAHELLGDDSEWKRKFATEERRHVSFHAYERGLRGGVSYGYRATARPLLKRAHAARLARLLRPRRA